MLNFFQLVRLHKPTGVLVLILPAIASLMLSKSLGYKADYVSLVVVVIIGGFFARSAGCIINDIFDRDIDALVNRTKERPIASGMVSLSSAYFTLFMCTLGAIITLFFLRWQVLVAAIIVALMIVVYPLMKRVTHFPQVFLGLVFNSSVLLMSIQINLSITPDMLIFYIICVLYTIVYDTIYALQDYNDDCQHGVKSIPTFFHQYTEVFIAFVSIIMYCTLLYLGYFLQYSIAYFGIIIILGIFLFLQNILILRPKHKAILTYSLGFNLSVIVYLLMIIAFITEIINI